MLRLFGAPIVVALVLQGCSKPQPALPSPHALDDATAASQRASEAMKGAGGTGVTGNPSHESDATSEKGERGKANLSQ